MSSYSVYVNLCMFSYDRHIARVCRTVYVILYVSYSVYIILCMHTKHKQAEIVLILMLLIQRMYYTRNDNYAVCDTDIYAKTTEG